MFFIQRLRIKSKSSRAVTVLALAAFILTGVLPFSVSQALAQSLNLYPAPGKLAQTSPAYQPALLRGVKIDPGNPFNFDFIVDLGETGLRGAPLVDEGKKLIRYFMAALTTPEEDLWVNLSPYEGDKIVPEAFGTTELGRDLLAQDYLLKQITASMTYPDDETGQKFWDRIFSKVYETLGTSDMPVSTFNKVWIVPDDVSVFVTEDTAYVVKATLKVMMEEDYLAFKKNKNNENLGLDDMEETKAEELSALSSNMIKDMVLPMIEKEVNEGKNFAKLRQMYHSLILGMWYKEALKETILTKIYVGQNKIKGIDIDDPDQKYKIFEQYVEAYKQGAFSLIREEYDPRIKKTIPRKYFSGGFDFRNSLFRDAANDNGPATSRTRDGAFLQTGSAGVISVREGRQPAVQLGGEVEGRTHVILGTQVVTPTFANDNQSKIQEGESLAASPISNQIRYETMLSAARAYYNELLPEFKKTTQVEDFSDVLSEEIEDIRRSFSIVGEGEDRQWTLPEIRDNRRESRRTNYVLDYVLAQPGWEDTTRTNLNQFLIDLEYINKNKVPLERIEEQARTSSAITERNLFEKGPVYSTDTGIIGPMRAVVPYEVSGVGEETVKGVFDAINQQGNKAGTTISGRSIIDPSSLNQPILFNNRYYRSLKIENVTDNGEAPKMVAYVEARDATTRQPKAIVTFDRENENQALNTVPAPAHPRGTDIVINIIEKFNVNYELVKKGIRTSLPIGIGQFTAQSFRAGDDEQPEPVGFLIQAIETVEDRRVGSEYIERMQDEETQNRPQIIRDFLDESKGAIRELRKVNDLGKIHSNPHIDQFGIINAPDDIAIYDFESAFSSSEIGRDEFSYRLIRDLIIFYTEFRAALTINNEIDIQELERFGLTEDSLFDVLMEYFHVELNQLSNEKRNEFVENMKKIVSDDVMVSLHNQYFSDESQFAGKGIKEIIQELRGSSDFIAQVIDVSEEIYQRTNVPRSDDQVVSSPLSPTEKVGGIDFTPEMLDLKIGGESVTSPIDIDPATIEKLNIDGLVPFIYNITPVTNLPQLLGVTAPEENMRLGAKK